MPGRVHAHTTARRSTAAQSVLPASLAAKKSDACGEAQGGRSQCFRIESWEESRLTGTSRASSSSSAAWIEVALRVVGTRTCARTTSKDWPPASSPEACFQSPASVTSYAASRNNCSDSPTEEGGSESQGRSNTCAAGAVASERPAIQNCSTARGRPSEIRPPCGTERKRTASPEAQLGTQAGCRRTGCVS